MGLPVVVYSINMGLRMDHNGYIRNLSIEFSKLIVVQCHWHLAIWSIWGCPWARIQLWNRWIDFLRSKLFGIVSACRCATTWSFARSPHLGWHMVAYLTHGPECISLKLLDRFSVRNSMELSRITIVQHQRHLPICLLWACPWVRTHLRRMDFPAWSSV